MQDKRFHASGFHDQFQQEQLSFDSYISAMRKIIASSRTDLNHVNQNTVLDANTPFSLAPAQPSKKGILLLHGLYDSPYTMQAIGKFFQSQNFWVRSVLLPGHGTVPGDLLHVSYQDWLAASRYGVDSLKDKVNELYCLGFSTGAALAIRLAQLGTPFSGLILAAPLISIKNRLSMLAKWHRNWRWLGPWSQWLWQAADNDYARYESITMNSIKQATLLTQQIKNHSQPLSQKIMLIGTEHDEVVSHRAYSRFMDKQIHPDNIRLIYADQERQIDNTYYRHSHYPQQRILNLSHQALLIPKTCPHFGEHGDYLDLRVYHSWLKHFIAPLEPPIYRGTPSLRQLRKQAVVRLTYNPDYDFMCQLIKQFITA